MNNNATPRRDADISKAQPGFSLIEVMMIIALLSLTILPLTLIMGQLSSSTRGSYIQSSRSLIMNSLLAEMNPERNNYVASFTDASKNSSYSESGQVLPFMRKVDITTAGATNSLKRTTNFYLYNNTSDADTAAYYKSRVVQSVDNLRLRSGDANGLVDTSNFFWFSDNSLFYDNGHRVPGPVSNYTMDGTPSGNIDNTSGNDDALFQKNRYAPTLNYNFNVDNGPYTVKLYFGEINTWVNGTTNRRVANITLEGIQMNTTPYSPFESIGANTRAHVQMYDTVVSDGILNITLTKNAAGTDPNAFLCAIQILKRAL